MSAWFAKYSLHATVVLLSKLFSIDMCVPNECVCYYIMYMCVLYCIAMLYHSSLKTMLGLLVDQQHNLLCTLVGITCTFDLM